MAPGSLKETGTFKVRSRPGSIVSMNTILNRIDTQCLSLPHVTEGASECPVPGYFIQHQDFQHTWIHFSIPATSMMGRFTGFPSVPAALNAWITNQHWSGLTFAAGIMSILIHKLGAQPSREHHSLLFRPQAKSAGRSVFAILKTNGQMKNSLGARSQFFESSPL